ncbi:MAG: type II toxin-antitoxin system VapC family toxin [Acidobacteriia bacterium]|nr:type II toxin-antitoxin system VapC family toxin [Terriglobia bacterium]
MVAEDPDSTVSALIFDTDILVWVLRRHLGAVAFVERVPVAERKISAISYLELLRGCRDLEELNRLSKHVMSKFGEVLHLSESITESASRLMERFALAHRPDVSDVIIAATALGLDETVATGNIKHFDFIPGLSLKRFRG